MANGCSGWRTPCASELGLGPADRFAVMALNSHEFLELYHAGFLGAGIVTPLNLRLAGAELQHIVRDSGARVVFVDASSPGTS